MEPYQTRYPVEGFGPPYSHSPVPQQYPAKMDARDWQTEDLPHEDALDFTSEQHIVGEGMNEEMVNDPQYLPEPVYEQPLYHVQLHSEIEHNFSEITHGDQQYHDGEYYTTHPDQAQVQTNFFHQSVYGDN